MDLMKQDGRAWTDWLRWGQVAGCLNLVMNFRFSSEKLLPCQKGVYFMQLISYMRLIQKVSTVSL